MDGLRLMLNRPLEGWDLVAPHGAVSAYVQAMPGRETPNEDSAAVLTTPVGFVLAVADGMGGGPDGDRASAEAISALAERLATPGEGVRGQILDAFEDANQRVLRLGGGAATTLSVVEIEWEGGVVRARSYHAGDSSLLICGSRGKLKWATVPHSPVGYAVEAGLLGSEEALHHDELNVVTNMVGTTDMRIDMGPSLTLSPRDTVVLGTDGLFDNVRTSEIVACIRKGSLPRAREALQSAVQLRMTSPEVGAPSKPDDTAIILFRPPARPRKTSSPK